MGVVPTTEIRASDIDSVTEARFWDLVVFDFRPSACWLFGGNDIVGDGYRRFKIDGIRVSAHRLSYALDNGITPSGLFVCHSCDTPQCVRPDHLFLGTPNDNMKDKVEKGRHAFGEKTGTSILTTAQVIAIHVGLRAGRSLMSLAKEYGVAKRTIQKIKSGENWAHLRPDDVQSPAYAFLVLLAGLVASCGLALAGEPQSVWVWRLLGVLP